MEILYCAINIVMISLTWDEISKDEMSVSSKLQNYMYLPVLWFQTKQNNWLIFFYSYDHALMILTAAYLKLYNVCYLVTISTT